MALCELHWFSATIQKQTTTLVLLPDDFPPPFAAFYLLHGLSDDQSIWMRRTRIESYAGRYPMMIVMPDGYRGFYTNNDEGPRYADHIAIELVEKIERTFAAIPERAARCIGGLSMGGYGALRLALGYPRVFASASSHSGALMAASRDAAPHRFPESRAIFGAKPRGSEHDLLHLARRCQRQKKLPAIYIDCGVDDFLLQDNRDFHAALQRKKIAHDYHEHPGNHNWDYWDQHVRDALEFHAAKLHLKPR